ncbi:MAG TPA: T9SS type A sorting domain-containing protein [Chitinophagales bacterium]|nr:T9SS type A sorting domain-containing protein [Chitinophagales bacterium]HRP39252.1 T9SS type A sorting domain-containing protein [Chitinophagales bacterium]
MKIYILILLNVAIYFTGFAQKWALPSSTWKIQETWFDFSGISTGYYTINVEKDTVIAGETCQKLSNGFVTLERNDTVFALYNDTLRSVMYFNAQVGDTVAIFDYIGKVRWHITPDESANTVWAIISKIDSIDVGNKYLKDFSLHVLSPSSILIHSMFPYSYMENLGGGLVFPYFYYDFMYDFPNVGTCNYGDSFIQNFWVYDHLCETEVGISENSELDISIYPNPAHSQINITSPYFNIATVDFYSLHGQRKNISINNNNSRKSQIDISGLQAGVYFLHLKLSNGSQYVHRLMKE